MESYYKSPLKYNPIRFLGLCQGYFFSGKFDKNFRSDTFIYQRIVLLHRDLFIKKRIESYFLLVITSQ